MKVVFKLRIVTTNIFGNAYMERTGIIPDHLPVCIGFTFIFPDFTEFTVSEMAYDIQRQTLELWRETVKTDEPLDEVVKEYSEMGFRRTA